MPTSLRIETIVSAPFQENSYLVWVEGADNCLVVDPGFEPDRVIQAIKRQQLSGEAVLNAHRHVDHRGGHA